ncbi:MAG: response regulator, partial [Merismopedia sp. SIO2A8]|nr:response regulator [Merismopedia sp. SIO2A8]
PDGVVVWITEKNRIEALELLEAIAQHPQEPFVLAITDTQDFPQRLQLVQQGVDRILPPSTPPQRLIEVIQQTIQSAHAELKVVIVDDEPHLLELIRALLSPWGWQLTTLDDPTHLWTTLETVQPHLLVLDVEMPNANGLEICQVLRAEDRWRQLPILFLTIHEDATTQQHAFNVGADDFISKSKMAIELPNRIANRLKRMS